MNFDQSTIQQTHQLIDKIELRVKQFMKTQSMKSLPLTQQQPLIQSIDQNTKYSQYLKSPQEKDHKQSHIKIEQYKQLENVPPKLAISQSRVSDGQMPLLKEIQDIDNFYKLEIEQLSQVNQELKITVDTLKRSLAESQAQLMQRQNQLQICQNENEKQKILIQTLRDENSYVTQEVQQLMNQHAQPHKLVNLQGEIQEERFKSEKLQMEIIELKQRVEKQRDSVKPNHEYNMIEKLVKKLEEAQELQIKQNQQFLKCVIGVLEKPQSSIGSVRPNSVSNCTPSIPKKQKHQSAQKYKRN